MAAASESPPSAREIVSSRVFPTSPAWLFAAFRDPAQLASWWGPAGFTNTIQEFDLRPGGKWRLVMRAPDGAEYANESIFLEVMPAVRVVYRHLQPVHRFDMSMVFAAEGTGSRLTWCMRFETAAEAAKLMDFIAAANEQNFDCLQAVLVPSAQTIP